MDILQEEKRVSAHPQGTERSFRFKQRKNWGRGREAYTIIKQS
jgi:hypothetical protein